MTEPRVRARESGGPDTPSEVLRLLQELPSAAVSGDDEALAFLDSSELHGLGLGWVDVHLLASARLSGLPPWTLDLALDRTARSLGLGRRDASRRRTPARDPGPSFDSARRLP